MKKLKVFYSDKQQVDTNNSFSPSAGKPKKVLNDWRKWGLPIEVVTPSPLSRSDIALAHDPDYVKGVLDLTNVNGFGNRSRAVADSLHWTTGSMASAAQYAVRNRSHAVSLTSGFHHACYNGGGGYCTFNGLVITAQLLKLNGYATKVGIIDVDQHMGNGTEHIIKKLELDIEHYTLGAHGWHTGNAHKFPKTIREIFNEKFKDCDIILIQLGADSHASDPLGGVFSTKQIRLRDRAIFELCKENDIPLVWNSAGGYDSNFRNVLACHRIAVEEYFNVFHNVRFDTKCEEECYPMERK